MTKPEIGIAADARRTSADAQVIALVHCAMAAITVRIVATALLVLAIGGSAAAQAVERDVTRPGLGDMTVTRHDVSRVTRTGLGDMALTRQDAPRVIHAGLGDMTLRPVGLRSAVRGDVNTRAPQHVATETPGRIPWLLIIASVLLAASLTGHHYRARRRRSGVAR